MVVIMNIHDASWMEDYYQAVPVLLAEYGAKAIAASRQISVIEGEGAPPDRVAVFGFPDLATLELFMVDDRYSSFRRERERGARSTILVMENEIDAITHFA